MHPDAGVAHGKPLLGRLDLRELGPVKLGTPKFREIGAFEVRFLSFHSKWFFRKCGDPKDSPRCLFILMVFPPCHTHPNFFWKDILTP